MRGARPPGKGDFWAALSRRFQPLLSLSTWPQLTGAAALEAVVAQSPVPII